MQIVKQITVLVDQATSDQLNEPANDLYQKILTTVNARVDMPKHVVAAISKRVNIKNKRVLIWSFLLLEFLAYNGELSLYAQISTKEFLFKISGLLMTKDVDPQVQDRILKMIHCFDQLFRPHQDLLPLFFQFYAGVLRKGFDLPNNYVSPYRPKELKKYNKNVSKYTSEYSSSSKAKTEYKPQPPSAPLSKTEMKTFEEIRAKLILTNEILENADPSEGVKGNALLLEMMQEIKLCEKKINETINQCPNENIMELALAANDDLYITYRRYKDLQRNKKPQPFILTELTSDLIKEQEHRSSKVYEQTKPVQRQSQPQMQPPAKKKEEINILDLDMEPPIQKQPETKPKGGDIFDLLDVSEPQPIAQKQEVSPSFNDLLGGGYQSNQVNLNPPPLPENVGFSLNNNLESQYRTDADIKTYGEQNAIQKLTDMSDFKDFLGGSK